MARSGAARELLPGLCALLLSACAGAVPEAEVVAIEGMVIENQGSAWVSAVRVLEPETGRFVSCGNIAPGSKCSTGFPATTYAESPVEVTWSQMGEIHSTGRFVMDLPMGLDTDRPATVRVVITGPGMAGAAIVQQTD
ncbi:MAG: hypothetical protein PVF46_04200 [Lysobacterales bacterium]|jgi:hypothetical protein